MTNYKNIFDKAEKSLREYSKLSEDTFEQHFGRFKGFGNKSRTDRKYFEMLVLIIFYSGFKASTIESKEHVILNHLADCNAVGQYSDQDMTRILSDPEMIRNRRKIEACISNAKVFNAIVTDHGSFRKYLDSFHADDSFENLLLLKEELEYRFEYLGGTTVYHFLTDLGYNVLKPDRVILRIFKRLGLIENEKQLLKTVIIGRKFAKATGHPIRYIDIIFVKYGQQGGSEYFGLQNGICLEKNPDCSSCGMIENCGYFRKRDI